MKDVPRRKNGDSKKKPRVDSGVCLHLFLIYHKRVFRTEMKMRMNNSVKFKIQTKYEIINICFIFFACGLVTLISGLF